MIALTRQQGQTAVCDFERDYSLVARTATVFGDVQGTFHLEAVADSAHQNDCVGIRQLVTTFNRSAKEFVE